MFKSKKKFFNGGLMFLLLGLMLAFSNSSPARQTGFYQQANAADAETFLFSKINFGQNHYSFLKLDSDFSGFGKVFLQKQVKVVINNPTDIDVEIKDVETKDVLKSDAYRYIGVIKAKSNGTIYTKSNRTIIARVVGKNIPPFSRVKMTDESEAAFQVQKVNTRDQYALVRGTKK